MAWRHLFRIDQNNPKGPASGIRFTREVQLPGSLFDNDKVKRGGGFPADVTLGLGMTLNGYLVANTMGGAVITLDRDTLKIIGTYRLGGSDELFLNAFATGSDPVFNGMHAPIKVDTQGRLMYGMAFGLVLMDTRRMEEIKTIP